MDRKKQQQRLKKMMDYSSSDDESPVKQPAIDLSNMDSL